MASTFLDETNSAEPLQIISKPGFLRDVRSLSQIKSKEKSTEPQYRWQIVWRNVLIFVYLHAAALYGLYLAITLAQWKSFFWSLFVIAGASLGVTVGAHRLWTHRTFKAKLPLRIFLAFWQTVALQNHVYEWSRDHRVHHKFTDTDADPHNSKRGFFFSHMGWLMVKKHQDVFIKGKTVDMSDLEADPVVMFQKKYYLILAPLLCFVFPAFVPWYFWNENPYICWYGCAIFRYVVNLHGTWSVNSAAHIWGTKPFDKNMNAVDNQSVAIIAFGEGWHNYHHVFPWDYKAAELGNYRMNTSTAMIDFFAKIGWAYDLKTVSVEMIKKRAERTGDGSRKYDDVIISKEKDDQHENQVWGWGDTDMTDDQKEFVEIYNTENVKSK